MLANNNILYVDLYLYLPVHTEKLWNDTHQTVKWLPLGCRTKLMGKGDKSNFLTFHSNTYQ